MTDIHDDAEAALTLRFTATPRGARLARRLSCQQMERWGWPYGSAPNDTVETVVAELAANAVTHGRAPGLDVELRLSRDDDHRCVRVEISDARGERLPLPVAAGSVLAEGGRGLALVAALAKEWGTAPRPGDPGDPGKTVWAVIACTPGP
ncbi:ATP-binding protein [Streptomyces sp. NPDC048290]|uniref:ATP-binding protein n=1 Tax=Streptomyces sp. NPDC048290 TaxID=3155811 RepID=UPI00342F4C8E